MEQPEDIVAGVLVGVKVNGLIVRLPDGREVAAIMDLPPLKHPWMVRSNKFKIGCPSRLKLGTVIEPIRIVEILDPA